MKDFNILTTALDQRASATITVVDYTLLAGKTITVQGTVLTEGVEFTAATSNAATATSIATAVSAVSGFVAAAVGATVTAYWTTPGTAGNAKTLATNAAVGELTISGATFAGGVAASYSDVISFDDVDELKNLEIVQFLEAISGSSVPTVTTTPQYSMDKVNWFDHTTTFATGFTVINTPQKLDLDFTSLHLRFKHVLSGTNPVATIRTQGVAK